MDLSIEAGTFDSTEMRRRIKRWYRPTDRLQRPSHSRRDDEAVGNVGTSRPVLWDVAIQHVRDGDEQWGVQNRARLVGDAMMGEGLYAPAAPPSNGDPRFCAACRRQRPRSDFFPETSEVFGLVLRAPRLHANPPDHVVPGRSPERCTLAP